MVQDSTTALGLPAASSSCSESPGVVVKTQIAGVAYPEFLIQLVWSAAENLYF